MSFNLPLTCWFQSALSQLTLQQVQLVLDELCWRERYGNCAAHSYNHMVEHIQYLTAREAESELESWSAISIMLHIPFVSSFDVLGIYSEIFTKTWNNIIISYSPQTLECYTCWNLWHKSLISLGAIRVNNYQSVQQQFSPLSLPTLQAMQLLPHKSPSTIILW